MRRLFITGTEIKDRIDRNKTATGLAGLMLASTVISGLTAARYYENAGREQTATAIAHDENIAGIAEGAGATLLVGDVLLGVFISSEGRRKALDEVRFRTDFEWVAGPDPNAPQDIVP